ncbi:MAG: class I SAM-dependent methyltransferase [Candidatus Aminicenantales bacterium]
MKFKGYEVTHNPPEDAWLKGYFYINTPAVAGDVRKLQFSDNYFDKVISSVFFEHLSPEDNALVLKEAYRVLRPGGALIIKTPRVEIYKPMITSLFERNLSI